MTLRKLVRYQGFPQFCFNGCAEHYGNRNFIGTRSATHIATIIGYDTPLCTKCAEEWKQLWDEVAT